MQYSVTAGLRPSVNEIRAEVKPHLLRIGMPVNQLAIDAFHAVTALTCLLHVPGLVARFSKEDRGGAWQLSNYRNSTA